jgi:hypothetical protein
LMAREHLIRALCITGHSLSRVVIWHVVLMGPLSHISIKRPPISGSRLTALLERIIVSWCEPIEVATMVLWRGVHLGMGSRMVRMLEMGWMSIWRLVRVMAAWSAMRGIVIAVLMSRIIVRVMVIIERGVRVLSGGRIWYVVSILE